MAVNKRKKMSDYRFIDSVNWGMEKGYSWDEIAENVRMSPLDVETRLKDFDSMEMRIGFWYPKRDKFCDRCEGRLSYELHQSGHTWECLNN